MSEIPFSNYKEAFETLDMHPENTSCNEVNGKIKALIRYNYSTVDRAYQASEFLKNNSPKKDKLDNNDLLNAYHSDAPVWQEYYEKYHIYFENRFKSAKDLFMFTTGVSVLSGLTSFYAFYQTITNNNFTFNQAAIIMSSEILCIISGYIAYKEHKIKNDKMSKFFMDIRKDINSKFTSNKRGK